MNHRKHKLLRVLRGEAPEVEGSEDYFDRLCLFMRDAIASEHSGHRVCKILAAEWLLCEVYEIDEVEEVDQAIEDAEMGEEEEIVFIDTKTLEEITDPKGFKLVGRVTDPYFEHVVLCLWKRDKQIALTAAV